MIDVLHLTRANADLVACNSQFASALRAGAADCFVARLLAYAPAPRRGSLRALGSRG